MDTTESERTKRIWEIVFSVWIVAIIAVFGVIGYLTFQSDQGNTYNTNTPQGEINVLIIAVCGIVAFLVCALVLLLIVIQRLKVKN